MNSKTNHLFFTLSFLAVVFLPVGCQKTNTLTPDTETITWQPTALDSLWIMALTVSPKGEVYAGTCEGIFRSSDQGESWEKLDLICPAGIAVNSNGYVFVTGGAGIVRSLDSGISWEPIRLSGMGQTRPLAFGKVPGVVYTSVGISDENLIGGIYRSEDNGATWRRTSFPDSMGAWAIAVNDNDDVFAGTGYGLFRSIDEAQSWEQLNVGFELDYGPIVDAIAIENQNGTVFIAIDGGGVYRSLDNGGSWQKTVLSNTSIVSLLISPIRSEYIFAGSRSQPTDQTKGIFYSTDSGKNWFQINTGLADLRIVQLAGDSLGFIYVATENSGVFRTVNPINK